MRSAMSERQYLLNWRGTWRGQSWAKRNGASGNQTSLPWLVRGVTERNERITGIEWLHVELWWRRGKKKNQHGPWRASRHFVLIFWCRVGAAEINSDNFLTFLSNWNAMLFRRKSPWQIVAKGSRGCTISLWYSHVRSALSSILARNSSGTSRFSSSFSRIAWVPRFGETFMVAPQIGSGSRE